MSYENLFPYARSFLGTPYIWGGNSHAGIDCSGLCIEILKAAGIVEGKYDSNAQGLYKDLVMQKKANENPQPYSGSLVFFGASANNITHVGFCVSADLMIEAGGGDSSCTTAEIAFKKSAFVKLRPIRHRQDIVAFLQPKYLWS